MSNFPTYLRISFSTALCPIKPESLKSKVYWLKIFPELRKLNISSPGWWSGIASIVIENFFRNSLEKKKEVIEYWTVILHIVLYLKTLLLGPLLTLD